MSGDDIICWTARLAVACYLTRVGIDLSGPASPRQAAAARWAWSVGCVIFLLHVAAVFEFQHHWSHAAAWEHTRERTLQTTGWNSGFGLWLNYLFAAWWVGDAAAWWLDRDWPRRRWTQWPLQAFFAFMVFNATVVFGPPGWMVVAAVFGVAVVCAARPWRKRYSSLLNGNERPI